MDFSIKLKEYVEVVNTALNDFVQERNTPEKTIYSAMKYSLMAGGKRLRPVLALAVTEMLEGNMVEVLPYACAVEMIHTYSLIHDDLPAMDNDDYRRGRLTNHKVYGEAMAILAGDALLNCAFETMADAAALHGDKIIQKVKAMSIIAASAGTRGMIGGQVVDLESEGKAIPEGLLEYMHKCKTGALIKAPIMAAAVMADADAESMRSLELFAEKIGLAFQIKDDIMDVEGSLEEMGKASGSDKANGKSTFVTLYGLDKSKEMLCTITNEALQCLEKFGRKAEFLIQLAEYLMRRKN